MNPIDPSPYLSLFIEEARENIAALNDKILLLEAGEQSRAVLDEVFRAAHTIKGMSATMGFNGIAELTHAMEGVLDALRSDQVQLDGDVIDMLFACVDALTNSLESVASGGPDTVDSALIVRVSALPSEEKLPEVQSSGLSLPEFDPFERTVLAEAKAKGFKAYWVRIRLQEGCLLKGVRAYMVLTTLEQIGEIIKAFPTVPELEEERFEQDFALAVVSQEAAAKLKELVLDVSEVQSVEIVEVNHLPPETPSVATPPVELQAPVPQAPAPDAPGSLPPAPQAPSPAPQATKAPLPQGGKAQTEAEPRAAETAPAKSNQTVRVPTDRLDRLVNLVGELVIDRNRLVENGGKVPELSETIRHIGSVISELQNVAMKLRMTPVERVFNRFPRMIRDLSRELGKEVHLQIEGQDTELDRLVIDEIGEPLVHLLRNALDHGIEDAAGRAASGKPMTATVRLSARHEGNHVIIEVADDGRGIDAQRVISSAISKGLITEEEGARLTDKQAYDLLFAPGFSTRETANAISGRGVGMDAVKSKVLSLGGAVEVDSVPGSGSTMTVMLPLTLAIIQAMLVEVGEAILALPLSFIDEAIDLAELSVQRVQDSEMVVLRGQSLTLIRLDRALRLPSVPSTAEEAVVVVRIGSKKAGLVVDKLLGQQEVVIKPISRLVGKLDHLSGAAILGDGRLALILDAATLV
jgi:two-component system chemotaxis sensor kinase CheA